MLSLKINGTTISTKYIKLEAGPNVGAEEGVQTGYFKISAEDSTVTVAMQNKPTISEWYTQYVNRKAVDILNGGKSLYYDFTVGMEGIYVKPTGNMYLVSVQNVVGDNEGGLLLSPSEIVDVYIKNGYIALKTLEGRCNICDMYKEIDYLVWRLYHAYNYLNKRLQVFNINEKEGKQGRVLGSLVNYQAVLARWNYIVWTRSFINKLESVREDLSISLGYTNYECTLSSANIHIRLELLSGYIPTGETKNSARFLTMYVQSANNNLNTGASITTKLSKTLTTGTEMTLGGSGVAATKTVGTKTVKETDQEWKYIDVDIDIKGSPAFKQNDSYTALFTLAPALNTLDGIYLENAVSEKSKVHSILATTTWTIGGNVYTKTETISLPALLVEQEVTEEPEDEED